jgi:hypothetical protein
MTACNRSSVPSLLLSLGAIRNRRRSFLSRITGVSLKPIWATSTPCNQHYGRKFCIEQIHRMYSILHKVTLPTTHLLCLLARAFTFLESPTCNEIVVRLFFPQSLFTRSCTCNSAYIYLLLNLPKPRWKPGNDRRRLEIVPICKILSRRLNFEGSPASYSPDEDAAQKLPGLISKVSEQFKFDNAFSAPLAEEPLVFVNFKCYPGKH